jgi:putative PIN family toxin of toxin-antitoxin system
MPSVVFDASTLVGALLKADSVPEKALVLARRYAVICMSQPVEDEIREVFARPRFAFAQRSGRALRILDLLMGAAAWHDPTTTVTDCRDRRDDKYLELALAAGADMIVSSDDDLLTLSPWRGIAIVNAATFVDLAAAWGQDAE